MAWMDTWPCQGPRFKPMVPTSRREASGAVEQECRTLSFSLFSLSQLLSDLSDRKEGRRRERDKERKKERGRSKERKERKKGAEKGRRRERRKERRKEKGKERKKGWVKKKRKKGGGGRSNGSWEEWIHQAGTEPPAITLVAKPKCDLSALNDSLSPWVNFPS